MNQIETAGVLRGAALQPFRRSVRGDPGGLTTLGSPFLQVTSVCHAHAMFGAIVDESTDGKTASPTSETRRSTRLSVNDEEQYSIWPANRDNPLGWKDAGKQGTRDECTAYIQEVWTDMRPMSLRRKMDAADG